MDAFLRFHGLLLCSIGSLMDCATVLTALAFGAILSLPLFFVDWNEK